MSGGTVQIFSLDETQPSVPVTPAASDGMPATQDSAVTIFPLSGDGSGYVAPGMMPPSVVRPDYQSPFPAPQTVLPSSSLRPLTSGALGVLSPSRIYFNHNSKTLDAAGRQTARDVANVYKSAPGAPLKVEGHASTRAKTDDPVERRLVNLKVSMDRALSVSRALIQNGVPADAIQTTAWGDTKPALVTPDRDAESASRRVEIFSDRTSY